MTTDEKYARTGRIVATVSLVLLAILVFQVGALAAMMGWGVTHRPDGTAIGGNAGNIVVGTIFGICCPLLCTLGLASVWRKPRA